MKTLKHITALTALLALTSPAHAETRDLLGQTFEVACETLRNAPQPIFVILLRIAFIFAVYSIICGQLFRQGAPSTFVIPALALLAAIIIGMAVPFHRMEFKPGLKALLLFLSLIAIAIIPYFGARWLSDDESFHERYRWILYGIGFFLFVFQFASL